MDNPRHADLGARPSRNARGAIGKEAPKQISSKYSKTTKRPLGALQRVCVYALGLGRRRSRVTGSHWNPPEWMKKDLLRLCAFLALSEHQMNRDISSVFDPAR